MGDRGQKKTNKMLEQQTQRANQFADVMGQRGAEDRGYSTGSRGKIDEAYWNLFNQTGEGGGGGGGGGGPAYQMATFKDPRENEAQAMYREWAKSGGLTDPQHADIITQGASSVPGLFSMLRRNIQASPGNFSQMQALARDEGRAGAEATLNARIAADRMRREGQQWGGTGLERTDESLIGRQMQVERERIGEQKAAQAAAAASAARGRAGADDAFRNRMAILGELRGLRGEGGSDLAYADRQLAGMRHGADTVSSRVQEQSLLDKIGQGANIAGGLASAFVSPMGGFSNPFKKKPAGDVGWA